MEQPGAANLAQAIASIPCATTEATALEDARRDSSAKTVIRVAQGIALELVTQQQRVLLMDTALNADLVSLASTALQNAMRIVSAANNTMPGHA